MSTQPATSKTTITFNDGVVRQFLIATLFWGLIGMLVGEMLAGTVVIETVFSRQGIGRIISDALMAKDLPVVQGVIFFSALVYVIVNTLVDLSYTFIDPRVRRSA